MTQGKGCCLTSEDVILVAVDGSQNSELALDEGIDMARGFKCKLFIIHVIDLNEEFMALAPNLADLTDREARKLLAKSRDKATAQEIDCETIVHFDDQTYRPIVEEAREKKVSLIVVGSHGRSALKRSLMGSVSLRVVAHSPCPVLVIPSPVG